MIIIEKLVIDDSIFVIRKWLVEDIELAKKLWLNPNVTKYISKNGLFSIDDIKKRLDLEIASNNNYGVQYWKIYLKDNNEFIGVCGLRNYDYQNGIYEFGIHLIDKYWRKNYGYNVSCLIIDYAFDCLKVNYLIAGHNLNNKASRKLLTKLGFEYSHDEFYKPTGLYHPTYKLFKNNKI